MERLLKLSMLVFLLSACAKSPGFKVEDYTFTRVEGEQKPIENPQAPGQPKPGAVNSKPAPKRGSVVRESNKIVFNPTDSKWDKDNIRFKAKVKLGEKEYGEVEFKGSKKDSRVLLTPVDESLNDKLKAQVICTSEGDSCDDFFIDVFYKEDNVIYQDQIIPKPKSVEPLNPPAASEPAPAKPSSTQPSQPAQPAPKGQTPAPTPAKTKPPEPKNKDPKKPKEEKKKILIQDGGVDEDPAKTSFVGISDEEIRQIFKMEDAPDMVDEGQPEANTPVPTTPAPTPSVKPAEPNKTEPKKETEKEKDKDKKETPSPQPKQSDDKDSSFEKLRVRDQVSGTPRQGWLKNGTDFFKLSNLPGMHFFIVSPNQRVKDYFGAFDLAVVMKKIGEFLQTMTPGRKLAVTAISKWGGGYLEPHSGHQNGTDIDIRYLTNNENSPSYVITRGKVNSTMLVSNQWKLFKFAYQTNMVNVFYVDRAVKKAMCDEARRVQDYKNGDDNSEGAEVLKRLQIWEGHTTHFHIHIRCPSDSPRCKRDPEVFGKVGC